MRSSATRTELLQLLTSKSGPVLPIAVAALTGWFGQHFPDLPSPLFGELVEALVWLTLSHLIQPTYELPETLASLERITDLMLRSAPDLG